MVGRFRLRLANDMRVRMHTLLCRVGRLEGWDESHDAVATRSWQSRRTRFPYR
jgi:hypothetical protein